MHFYKEEKTALFIDGANLYAATKALEFDIDYKRLLQWASSNSHLVRAFYYTAVSDDQDYSPLRPLVDWLDYNGYSVIKKPTREYVDDSGHRRVKGNMNIELAIDMMQMADHIDHVILFSGDGDFRRLLEAIQRKGLRTTVISTTQTTPSMISDDLRRQADYFLELDLLAEHIQKDYNPTFLSDEQEEEEEYA